jgi:hypothetical protein
VAVSIITGVLQVNQLRNNANLSQGKFVANAWSIFGKTNVFDQIAGNLNIVPTGAVILGDSDLIDTNIPNAGGQSPVVGGNAEVI